MVSHAQLYRFLKQSKMRINVLTCVVLALCTILFTGCKKDADLINNENTSTLKVVFNHKVGSQPLLTNGTIYTNDQGETYTVNNFKYYISNISLKKTDGSYFVLPKTIDSDLGYFLINNSNPSSKTISLSNIPEGDYTAIAFNIGTDEQRDTSGAQTGMLSVDSAMFWGWNFGYIYMKLEGNCTINGTMQGLMYHIGGSVNFNCIRKTECAFNGSVLSVRANTSPEIEINTDVSEIFKTPNSLSFVDFSSVMSGKDMGTIADNYVDMFSVEHIHD